MSPQLKKQLLLGVVGLLVLALAGWGLSVFLGGKTENKAKAPKISLIPSTPPPPPPPPKEDKKPEPKEQKEQKVEQQAPKEAPPAPSAELKMDGPAGNGPSAFSAGKITSDDLSKALGNGAGGLFNPYNNFASAVKGEMQRYLSRQKELRTRSYRIELQIWVDRDGQVTRHQIVGSSGDPDVDALISKKIDGMGRFGQAPPERMPQPIRLRLVIGA